MKRKLVVIVGGGLAGLCAAKELLAKNAEVILLESGRCLGGRVQSISCGDPTSNHKFQDLDSLDWKSTFRRSMGSISSSRGPAARSSPLHWILEVGAQWIHDARRGNPAFDQACRADLSKLPAAGTFLAALDPRSRDETMPRTQPYVLTHIKSRQIDQKLIQSTSASFWHILNGVAPRLAGCDCDGIPVDESPSRRVSSPEALARALALDLKPSESSYAPLSEDPTGAATVGTTVPAVNPAPHFHVHIDRLSARHKNERDSIGALLNLHLHPSAPEDRLQSQSRLLTRTIAESVPRLFAVAGAPTGGYQGIVHPYGSDQSSESKGETQTQSECIRAACEAYEGSIGGAPTQYHASVSGYEEYDEGDGRDQRLWCGLSRLVESLEQDVARGMEAIRGQRKLEGDSLWTGTDCVPQPGPSEQGASLSLLQSQIRLNALVTHIRWQPTGSPGVEELATSVGVQPAVPTVLPVAPEEFGVDGGGSAGGNGQSVGREGGAGNTVRGQSRFNDDGSCAGVSAESPCSVYLSTGERIDCDAVLCTVSLGVLKRAVAESVTSELDRVRSIGHVGSSSGSVSSVKSEIEVEIAGRLACPGSDPTQLLPSTPMRCTSASSSRSTPARGGGPGPVRHPHPHPHLHLHPDLAMTGEFTEPPPHPPVPLRNESLHFVPVLPDWKQRAILARGFGRVEKLFIRYEHRWWRATCGGWWVAQPRERSGSEPEPDQEKEKEVDLQKITGGCSATNASSRTHYTPEQDLDCDKTQPNSYPQPQNQTQTQTYPGVSAHGLQGWATAEKTLAKQMICAARMSSAEVATDADTASSLLPAWAGAVFCFWEVPNAPASLMCWLTGPAAQLASNASMRATKSSSDRFRLEVDAIVAAMAPPGMASSVPPCVAAGTTHWSQDPAFRGSYSFPAAGEAEVVCSSRAAVAGYTEGDEWTSGITSCADLLALPLPRAFTESDCNGDAEVEVEVEVEEEEEEVVVDNMKCPRRAAGSVQRLFFAGEATSKTRYSTMDGAMSSGVRAAAEILTAIQQCTHIDLHTLGGVLHPRVTQDMD